MAIKQLDVNSLPRHKPSVEDFYTIRAVKNELGKLGPQNKVFMVANFGKFNDCVSVSIEFDSACQLVDNPKHHLDFGYDELSEEGGVHTQPHEKVLAWRDEQGDLHLNWIV
jgi:hypothetical protein